MRRLEVMLALACLALPWCKGKSGDLPDKPWAAETPRPAAASEEPGLDRSSNPISGKARTPYTLRAGKKASLALYAIEGVAEIPDWGAAGSSPGAVRDDDLLTAWTCTQSDDARPCAISLVLPGEAEVHIIRLFAGSGASREQFGAHARIKSVRVHTDAGWADGRIKRGWDHRHIILPAGIRTRSVTIEVTRIRPGSMDRAVHLADLEVFGITGKQRAPLEIEPRAALVRCGDGMWEDVEPGPEEEADTSVAGECFVELADGQGGARRILRGTGLVGDPGDRLFLVERTASTFCPRGANHTSSGSFTLVDTRTRLFWDVGQLGGVMNTLFRHPAGTGFASSRSDGSGVTQAGGVLVEGKLFKLLRDREWKFESDSEVEAWGFTDEGRPCCPAADESQWEKLCKPIGLEKARKILGSLEGEQWEAFWDLVEDAPGDWSVCGLEGELGMLAYRAPECEEQQSLVATMDGSGRVKDTLLASSLRLGASFEQRRLVEAVSGERSSVYKIGSDGTFSEIYPGASFSLPPAPLCDCFMN